MVRRGGQDRLCTAQMVDECEHVRHRVDRKPGHNGGFIGVFRRHKHARVAELSGFYRHGEHTAHRMQRTGKRKLARKNAVVRVDIQLAGGFQ